MKSTHITIIALAIALLIAAYHIATGNSNQQTNNADSTSANANSQAYQSIMTRTSVRAYSDRTITNQTIDSLLHAAMAAPTARNQQPWHFVVITNRATLDSIASQFQNISMASQAPIAIAVCGDINKTIQGEGQDYWVQDCSAATENILIAANAMNLGAVWCGIYPIQQRIIKASKLLQLPDNLIPLNIIPIGYPAAPNTPKNKFDQKNITYRN